MPNDSSTINLQPPRWARGLLSVLVIFIVIYLIALTRNVLRQYNFVGRENQQTYTISIDGEGKVTATPDIAEISIGLLTEHANVGTAQAENTRKMNAVIAAMQEKGVAEKDLQTSNYSIYPQYDYTNGRQTLRNYQVSQQVTVKIRDLEKVGDIVALAGTLGANQVSGLTFTIDEPESLRQEAREEALVNAKAKAEALAKIAGVKLGRLVSFTETGGGAPSPIPYLKTFDAREAGQAVAAPDIQAGSQDIIIHVNVVYEVL